MIATTFSERKTAKIKFFAAYIISVLLIIVILASVLNINPINIQKSNAPILPAEKDYGKTVDELLHNRMDKMNVFYAAFLANDTAKTNRERLQKEETDFGLFLDSLKKENSLLQNSVQQQEVEKLLQHFRQTLDIQNKTINNFTFSNKTDSTASATNDDAAIQELKGFLVQKEEKIQALEKQRQTDLQEHNKTVTMLQSQLAARANVTTTQPQSNTTEWKEKYDKTKALNDTYSSQIAALKKSYKEVVDDNRRLISQLQAARAGKNR